MVLTAADSKALCVTCHEEQAKQIASAKVQHSGAQGDCTTCHNPHAGKSPDFLQPDPVTVCLACHSDQAAEFKKKHLHQPAFEQACSICHVAHGNDNANLLRVADVNDPVPGVPRTGFAGAAKAPERAPHNNLRRKSEASRGLLQEHFYPAAEVWSRTPHGRAPRYRRRWIAKG